MKLLLHDPTARESRKQKVEVERAGLELEMLVSVHGRNSEAVV